MKLKSILTVAFAAASIMVMAGGKNTAMAACAGLVGGGATGLNTLCTTQTGATGLDGQNFMWGGAVGTTNNQFGIGAAGSMSTDSLGIAGGGTGLAGGLPPQVAYAGTDYTAGVGPTSGYLLNQGLFGMCSAGGCAKFIPRPGVDVAAFDTGSNTASLTYANFTNATGGTGAQPFSTIPVGTANFNQGTFETGLVTGFAASSGATAVLSQRTYHHAFAGAGTDGDYVDQRLAQQITGDGAALVANGPTQKLLQSLIAQAGSGGTVAATYVNTVGAGNIDATWVGNGDGCGKDLPAPALVGNKAGNCGVVNQQIADNIAGAGITGVAGAISNGGYGQVFNPLETPGLNTILPVVPTAPNTVYNVTAVAVAASAMTLP